MTVAEREELELRRRRADGTPVTPESFAEWKLKFDAEMKILKEERQKEADVAASGGRKKGKGSATVVGKDDHKIGRATGKAQFSDKSLNLEALEAAAENAQTDPDEVEDDEDEANNVVDNSDDEGDDIIQEELFDLDDEDLDDLDFDDDDDDDEDDEDVDI